MSDADADVGDVQLYPGMSAFECPECGHRLPLNSWTECDRCGAHLSLKVKVEAPGIDP